MKITNLNNLEEDSVSHNPRIRKKVMLKSGELGPLTQLARAVFPPGEMAAAHCHVDMGEVFLVQSGTGTITINGAAHKLIQGVCVAVEPGEQHEIRNTGNDDLVLVYFGIKIL